MRLKYDNWRDIILKSHVLPVELVIWKLILIKLYTDISQCGLKFQKKVQTTEIYRRTKATKQMIVWKAYKEQL